MDTKEGSKEVKNHYIAFPQPLTETNRTSVGREPDSINVTAVRDQILSAD